MCIAGEMKGGRGKGGQGPPIFGTTKTFFINIQPWLATVVLDGVV